MTEHPLSTRVDGPAAAFAMRRGLAERLFAPSELLRLQSAASIDVSTTITDFGTVPDAILSRIEVLITGWESPRITSRELDRMPRLAAIVHAAGTVKEHLSADVWDRGILVTSAAAANAYPVAEYAVAMIILAGKGVLTAAQEYTRGPRDYDVTAQHDIGNYRRTVGIIGASRIGRRVIELLEPLDLEIVLYDPYVGGDDPILQLATSMPLDELFRRSSIVSIHAPLLAETRGMVGARQLELLPIGSTVINTARAAILDQAALAQSVRERGIRVILDVTDPEPLPDGHELWSLPGVFITPHIAGALGNELQRLGESATREVERFTAGLPPEHPVSRAALVAMA